MIDFWVHFGVHFIKDSAHIYSRLGMEKVSSKMSSGFTVYDAVGRVLVRDFRGGAFRGGVELWHRQNRDLHAYFIRYSPDARTLNINSYACSQAGRNASDFRLAALLQDLR